MTLKQIIEHFQHPDVAAIYHDGSWKLVLETPEETPGRGKLVFKVHCQPRHSTKHYYRDATEADGPPPEGTEEKGWRLSDHAWVGESD